ncbi:hypothetical protein FDECE_889 [Fusarium decemcellulare]|nr:hypothetical protein FDECE_889 [Fusarium decemcellulare]
MSLFAPPPPGIYEYTEVLTFQFTDPSTPASLSDEATDAGKVWAFTLSRYLGLEQTGTIWWALIHGAPQKAKLFIDWKTAQGRDDYEASPEAQEIRNGWESVTASPVHSAIYRLPSDKVARSAGLHTSTDTVSALFTFKFNSQPSSDEAAQWDASFASFARAVLKSPGGVVATTFSYGWELNRSSFCAAFRYLDIESMQSFVGQENGSQLFGELQSRATGGVEVEFLETRVYDQGWQGSVDKTRPENPAAASLIAHAQNIFQGFNH